MAAFVEPAPGHEVDRNEPFTHAHDHLAPHKTPKHWFAGDEFPMTGSGKIQKNKLRDDWVAGQWSEL